MPLQTYGAVPVQNAATLVNEVAPRIQAAISTNFTVNLRSEAQWYSNHTAMVWTELPFVVPFFLSMKSGEGEFFYFGLFPPPDSATNAPPPQELINSLARTNLLYYDWEITEERLRHWRALTSLADVFRFERTFPTNTPSQLWLTAVTTNLGNAVTEISLLPPKGLDFVRRAHLGLTGFELVALARWVDASNFPISGDQGPAPAGKNAASTPVKP